MDGRPEKRSRLTLSHGSFCISHVEPEDRKGREVLTSPAEGEEAKGKCGPGKSGQRAEARPRRVRTHAQSSVSHEDPCVLTLLWGAGSSSMEPSVGSQEWEFQGSFFLP